MDLERARFLVSPAGRAALASVTPEVVSLPLVRRMDALRKQLPPDHAAALSEQLDLRQKATDRFGDHRDWLYTGPGLEMMTHPLVAERRAKRLAALGLPVLDLTCGIGGDLGAVVAAGATAVGFERDPATALLASHNTGADVVVADANHPPANVTGAVVLLDPARRSDRGRLFDPASFTPHWDTCLALAQAATAGVIKAPPGLPHDRIPPGAEAEFVQLGRGMREAALWFGAGVRPGLRRAVLLPAGQELDSSMPEAPAEVAAPAAFVLDPHSCVTRAGLVRHLAFQTQAAMLDPDVAYLTSDAPEPTPFADTFRVLDVLPFSVARLKGRLKAGGWRADEIRRRAFPIEPDELRRLLGPSGGDRVTLVCTTISGQRTVFIAQRVA